MGRANLKCLRKGFVMRQPDSEWFITFDIYIHDRSVVAVSWTLIKQDMSFHLQLVHFSLHLLRFKHIQIYS